MVKKINLLVFLLGVLVFGAAASFSQEDVSYAPAWLSTWEEARALVAEGAYLEAEEIYEALLENPDLGARAAEVEKEYEALQIQIIFSPLETPESISHTIEPGDSLYELAKKYNTTVALLRKSNGIEGDKIIAGKKLKVSKAQFSIVVQKRRNRLTLLADGNLLKRYKVATGTDGSTPAGAFKIVNKLENPTWFRAGAVVPPDSPDNILGTRWLGFDSPGYGIHGTTLPETIGQQASKGCIRMLNEDVEELYDIVPTGTEVTVRE
jgi:lipoprotein-anchoring transpeptidase ErfK/SrfK